MNDADRHTVKPVVDIHIHVGGKGNSSPCRMSRKFLSSLAYVYMVVRSGINPLNLVKDHDRALATTLIDRLNGASSVNYGVLLALDGVYDRDGNFVEGETHMLTPNEYVMKLAHDNGKVLFGASVNPNRGKAGGMDELKKCMDGGAVLVKWIPNSQRIDPSDSRHIWFYEALAKHGIPLLCHTGQEHAVPVNEESDQALGNPRRFELALNNGVTVIAAHCATPFFPLEKNYLGDLSAMMKEAGAKGWKLYADISAMCSFTRIGIFDDVLSEIPESRMVLGSDYPVPVDNLPPYLCDRIGMDEYIRLLGVDNPIEKNYRQLLSLDFPESAMTRSAEVIRMPK
jgi:uncharacterized protein